MITNVIFSELPIAPGESRALSATTDTEPLVVAIQCFREPPTPPSLRPCKECGTFPLRAGEVLYVTASQTFEHIGGYLKVTLTDGAGDAKEYKLTIEVEGGAQAYAG